MRMSAWEAEKQLHELHKAIYEEVDLTHPIVHNGNNVCSLVKEGNLKANLKLAELKEMSFFWNRHRRTPRSKELIFKATRGSCLSVLLLREIDVL